MVEEILKDVLDVIEEVGYDYSDMFDDLEERGMLGAGDCDYRLGWIDFKDSVEDKIGEMIDNQKKHPYDWDSFGLKKVIMVEP